MVGWVKQGIDYTRYQGATMKPYNPYKQARQLGNSHESAIVFSSRNIVNQEIQSSRGKLSADQLHTVISNTREDVSAITGLLASIGAQQRRIQWLLSGCLISLSIIAVAVTAML